jgi:hypothetical protein
MTTLVATQDHVGPVSISPAATAAIVAREEGSPSRAARYAGGALTGLAALFLLFDATMKVIEHPMAVSGTAELGYQQNVIVALGVVQLACLAVYLIPRTAILGAVLWTGYLGGAIATHVRVGNPLFSHVLFPVYVALLLWGGVWLREPRLRALLPLRASK